MKNSSNQNEEIMHSSLRILFLLMFGILFGSCDSKDFTISDSHEQKKYSAKYVLDICSKVIAYNVGISEDFEKKFIRELIDENGIPNRNLFLFQVLNSINLNELEIISDKLSLDFKYLS